jgi:hypothetical protein
MMTAFPASSNGTPRECPAHASRREIDRQQILQRVRHRDIGGAHVALQHHCASRADGVGDSIEDARPFSCVEERVAKIYCCLLDLSRLDLPHQYPVDSHFNYQNLLTVRSTLLAGRPGFCEHRLKLTARSRARCRVVRGALRAPAVGLQQQCARCADDGAGPDAGIDDAAARLGARNLEPRKIDPICRHFQPPMPPPA